MTGWIPCATHNEGGHPDGRSAATLPDRPAIEILLEWLRGGEGFSATLEHAPPLELSETKWAELHSLALAHGVLPLLWRNLQPLRRRGVCSSALGGWETDFRSLQARNLRLCGELLRVTGSLIEAGIRVIPFKGAVLAAAVYGGPWWRQFVDLDILIPRVSSALAIECLVSQGYSLCASREVNSHVRLVEPRHAVTVELQWDLGLRWELRRAADGLPLDFEQLWRRRETVPLCGHSLPSLSPEDLLLVLSVHGARHQWKRLIWLCDIAQLLRARPELDWDYVLARAVEYRCLKRLRLALALASDLLGAEPTPAIAACGGLDRSLAGFPEKLRRRLSAAVPGAGPWSGHNPADQIWVNDLAELSFYLSIRDRWWERIPVWLRFLRSRLQPQGAVSQTRKLPFYARAASRLIRPLRLASRYGLRSLVYLVRVLWSDRALWKSCSSSDARSAEFYGREVEAMEHAGGFVRDDHAKSQDKASQLPAFRGRVRRDPPDV